MAVSLPAPLSLWRGIPWRWRRKLNSEGEMSLGKRNAQWLGEVGAGWGTPGSPECSVHGQIAQVSRGRQDVGGWSGAS